MGRDRRRTGPANRLRRFLYGLLLLAAAPVAAADPLAGVGKYRGVAPPPAPALTALATVEGLLVLRARADGGPDITLDSATARVPQPDSDIAPQFRIDARSAAAGSGAAFDLVVADVGVLRLRLDAGRSPALSAWALGGTLELAPPSGPRLAAAVPTLRVNDMFGSEMRYLAFDAKVTRDRSEEPRLAFRWRI